jgi:hypothetical protein
VLLSFALSTSYASKLTSFLVRCLACDDRFSSLSLSLSLSLFHYLSISKAELIS